MRCLFLLVFWSVSILILTPFVPKDKLDTPSNKIISHSLELRLPKNQLGAFRREISSEEIIAENLSGVKACCCDEFVEGDVLR